MASTTTSVAITRRARKRHRAARGPVARITITCATSCGDADGWMHELQVASADELRDAVRRDLDEVVGKVWGGV